MGLDIMFYRVSHPRKQKKGESLNDYLWDVKHKQDKDFAKEAKEFINDWLAKSNDIESKDVAFEIRQLYFNLKGKYFKEHDEETSKELLPTQSGFFFGSTDYDEWYYEDMVNILREFGKLLKDWRDDDIVFVYMSW